jgi:hypothetical protein
MLAWKDRVCEFLYPVRIARSLHVIGESEYEISFSISNRVMVVCDAVCLAEKGILAVPIF